MLALNLSNQKSIEKCLKCFMSYYLQSTKLIFRVTPTLISLQRRRIRMTSTYETLVNINF